MLIRRSFSLFLLSLLACSGLNADTSVILGGATGNANFESYKSGAEVIQFSNTPHWFHASGVEEFDFTTLSETSGSSDPNSRACIPFPGRVQVNDCGHLIDSAGEVFSLSFDFGRTGENWDGDESYTAFLFTTPANVDESLTTSEILEIASISYSVPDDSIWNNQIQFNAFFVSTSADVGRVVHIGMVLNNPSGAEVSPRLDEVNLVVDADFLAGDVNSDGQVDLLDVSSFVALVTSQLYLVEADVNLDGQVDLLDVSPFVNLLLGG